MPIVKNSTEFFKHKVKWVNGLNIIHKHYNLDLQSQQQCKLDHCSVKAWTLHAQQRVQEPSPSVLSCARSKCSDGRIDKAYLVHSMVKC